MTMTDETPKPANSVPPPPRARNRGLNIPVPKTEEIPDNLSKPNSGIQDMNFKVPSDFHRAFKMSAASRNMPMKEMLVATYRCWVEVYGDDDDKKRLASIST